MAIMLSWCSHHFQHRLFLLWSLKHQITQLSSILLIIIIVQLIAFYHPSYCVMACVVDSYRHVKAGFIKPHKMHLHITNLFLIFAFINKLLIEIIIITTKREEMASVLRMLIIAVTMRNVCWLWCLPHIAQMSFVMQIVALLKLMVMPTVVTKHLIKAPYITNKRTYHNSFIGVVGVSCHMITMEPRAFSLPYYK